MSLNEYPRRRFPNKLDSGAIYHDKPDITLEFGSIADFRAWVKRTNALLIANTDHPTNYVPVYTQKVNQFGGPMFEEPGHPLRPNFGHELYLLHSKIIEPYITRTAKDGELGSLDYEITMDDLGTTR